MARVNITDLTKSFGRTRVVDRLSLSIPEGAFSAILGPSGCGKTTLLRLVAGLERPDAGHITIGGRDVTHLAPERRRLGMMFQSYALMPHMTVAENVRFPLRMQRLGNADEQAERVHDALDLVRLGHVADRLPRQLSGGQQQRVALARAVISRPPVLLLDEPLSNLDAQLRKDMQVELIELHRRLSLTTIFVTHDQDEALSLADAVILMNRGRVEQQGTPRELYDRPGSRFAAEFLGAANLLEARLTRDPAAGWQAAVGDVVFPVDASGPVSPGPATVVLRQEDLHLTDDPSAWDVAVDAFRIETRVYQGSATRFIVRLGGQRLSVLATKAEAESAARATHVCWRRTSARLLPAGDRRNGS